MPEKIMDIKRRFEAFEGFNGCQRGAGKCNPSQKFLSTLSLQWYLVKDIFDIYLLSILSLQRSFWQRFLVKIVFEKISCQHLCLFRGGCGQVLGALGECLEQVQTNRCPGLEPHPHGPCSSYPQIHQPHIARFTCSVVIPKSTSSINHTPLLRCRGERGGGCFQAGLEHGLAWGQQTVAPPKAAQLQEVQGQRLKLLKDFPGSSNSIKCSPRARGLF